MGRRERPINPSAGPAESLAAELRELRMAAGAPTYREMAGRAHFSDTTLSLAASGSALPSLDVTLGYVRACGGDTGYWQVRWRQAAAQLGREPGQSPDLNTTATARRAFAASAEPRPAQLPCGVSAFAGRTAELADLDRLRREGAALGTGITIIAITGAPGVGKTALGVHWARQLADEFPDGQLYIDLRGFGHTGDPASPAEAIRGFLAAFGVPADRIPVTLSAQAGLYRSLLAGRRALIVLDNARDAEQVRELLPGSPGCLTLITSRSQLTSLVVAEGARPLVLDVPSEDESRDLLSLRLGAARVTAEPEAVADIIGSCARLPLALGIVAGQAAIHSRLAMAAIAGQLRDSRQVLDELDGHDPLASTRVVFSWSYENLSAESARLFRLTGLHPGPDISTTAAASLAGCSPAAVRPMLAELVGAHLLSEPVRGRFGCHELLRAYAAEQVRQVESSAARRSSLRRMLDHYLLNGNAAAALLFPGWEHVQLGTRRPRVSSDELSDRGRALAWFSAEYRVSLAATAVAAREGFDQHAWQLPWTLAYYLDRQGHWHEWAEVLPIALAAAARGGDLKAQALSERAAARAYMQLGRDREAKLKLQHTLGLLDQLDDRPAQARVYFDLSVVAEHLGKFAEALDYSDQAAELFAELGDERAHARALNAIGWYYSHLGAPDKGVAKCKQAAMELHACADSAGEAAALDSLGYAYHQLGNYREAIVCYQRAHALSIEIGLRWGQATALGRLGDAYLAYGDEVAAVRSWQQALTIFSELDHRDGDEIRAKLYQSGSLDSAS